jgi:hypothetical protein
MKFILKNIIRSKDWEKKKIKIREKFDGITDKDLNFTEGNEGKMVEKLALKLGISAKEILNIFIEF